MTHRPALRNGMIGALALVLALLASLDAASADEGSAASPVTLEVRVWQVVSLPERVYISARPAGGEWDALGTVRLRLDDGLSKSGHQRYGEVTVAGVELRVWQDLRDPLRVEISARVVGGHWGALGQMPLPLDDGHTRGGGYRYGDLTIAVPTVGPGDIPAVRITPGGEDVPRLAALRIAFRDPPPGSDAARIVALDPVAEGSFVWLDDVTLLFQPAFPGWQRGGRYEVSVDAVAAGLAADEAHTFTVGGQLEVSYVIPGDGDEEVPTNAQILVQFNRAVAPLTVLQEETAPPVLEFEPPLTGSGEWLNTSLYRFIPADLAPSTDYAVRIRAGLTAATDGVLTSDFAWRFATIQPAATGVTPHNEATFVEPDTPIVVTFNQPMDRASVEAGLALRPWQQQPVGGAFSWNEDSTQVTFTPGAPLAMLSRHDVIVPAGLRGAMGGATRSERAVSFETIGPPELERTRPWDGASGAQTSGIRLYYNNPMDIESFEGRISISGIDPAQIRMPQYLQQGASEIRFDVPLQFSTTYTVRIAEGVRDLGGRPLPAHEFSFTTGNPWGGPYLRLAAPASLSTFSADREQVLHFHAARLGEVRFQLFRLSDAEAETLLRRGFVGDWWWTDTPFSPAGAPLREWAEEVAEELRDEARLYATVLGADGPLGRGHYFLTAMPGITYSGDPLRHRVTIMFSVVDTAVVTKLAFDALLVWALDHDSGEPLDATAVRAVAMDEWGGSLNPYVHATTDADGLARFPIPSEEGHRLALYGHNLVRIDGEGRLGVGSTWWDFGSSPGALEVPTSRYVPSRRGHLFTERPIYRPGETVSYKGVVRDEDDASYAIPGADAIFTVTVSDPRYDDLLTSRVALSEIGTFSGEIILPADAPTGRYWVGVTDEQGTYITATRFTVAEFRAPEFKVEVEAPKTDYLAGETIAAEARASFFFGGPVAGANTEWSAHAWPTVIRVEGYEDYSFWDSGIPYWARRDWDSPRSSGEARTDDSGVARLDVPGRLEPDEGTHRFTISATVTDANGQAVAGSTTVTVHPATWYAGIKPESYVATAGEAATVHLVSVDYQRRIAPHRPVTVRAYKREWVPTEERVYYAGAYYRSEPRDTEVDMQSVTTDAAGEASVEFTPPSAGIYRLVAESIDDQGRVARSARYLWVSGAGRAAWPVRDDDVIELIADRDSYEVGDVAEVLVPAPVAGATGLVTIERGRVRSAEVRGFETNSEVLRIPIEDEHIPNIYLGVVLYRPPTEDDPYPRYHVGYVELSVSTAPRRLDVRIRPDREEAQPGETVGYEVLVTDSEGEGVEAEVSVAVVDQAVLSLADEVGPDGMGAFWFERALAVRTASSLAASIDRRNADFHHSAEGEEGSGNDDARRGAPIFGRGGDGAAAEAAPGVRDSGSDLSHVRSDFRYTALWIGQLQTDERGRAEFELQLPDNATTWRARARAVTAETRVGEGESELLVTQPLLVRPALPRFLRVGDEVTLRTLVTNRTAAAVNVIATIEAQGVAVDRLDAGSARIEPGRTAVFGWPARALEEGTATVRFRATTAGGGGDAVELRIPVHLDVTPETTATGGVVEDTPAVEAVFLPDYVITGQGALEVALQASLVGALDTELGHFLPPHSWESNVRIASRIVALVAVQRASASGLTDAQEGQLRSDIKTLVQAQHYDGGWAWCRTCYRTDIWVTSWVLVALAEAREGGYAVPEHRYTQAAQSVMQYVDRQTRIEDPPDPNLHAFLLYALAKAAAQGGEVADLVGQQAEVMQTIVDEHRASFASWGRAYLVLGLLAAGHDPDHQSVRTLLNDITAHTIASANGNHWQDAPRPGSMHNGSVRATALVLRALTEAEPRHPLIEETARWLVHGRSADRWKSSVERAQGMASLGAFAELTGETRGVFDYQVLLNTRRLLEGHFDVPSGDYRDGATVAIGDLPLGEMSRVQFERPAGGPGRMYYALNLRYVTPAQGIEALNRGFAVSHRYSLLDDPDRAVTSAALGEVVRVQVTVVAPADRLFVRFDDFLPAGLEPIDPKLRIVSPSLREQLRADQRGAQSRAGPSYYAPWLAWYYNPWDQVDIRDDRVTLLAARLPEGVHEYVYYARATTPGDFFVAPAHAEETYFPEVFGRSDSSRFTVTYGE